ncbi:hypothetical protein GOV06_01705 [Candidatus Woesearchaeota archaeon]|nr:hypothetical protein [Candidatus Woesearchaeota archaeon]
MAAKKKDSQKSKFTGYIDMFSQVVAGFVEQRLKIKQRVEDVKSNVLDALYNFKAQIFRSVIEGFLLLTGIAALVAGSIMFLSRYLPLDILLLAYGIIISFAVLFIAKLKR